VNSPRKTPSFKTWLTDAIAQLAAVPSPRLDAEIILAHTIGKPRTYIHAHPDEALTERQTEIANARIDLRVDRVPIAYIIGHKDFYGRRFTVTTATLVPRPESELMIDLLKEAYGHNASLFPEKQQRLVDVGTGSGNLGITAKLEIPALDVTLVDNSRYALGVAEINANALGAEVRVLQSDLLASYPFKADFILANLPYVDPAWERSPETNHEPTEALFADDGGKALIIRLIRSIKQSLVIGGYLFIEADPEQHAALIGEARKQELAIQTQQDYQLVFRRLA
jgi:release factor glutamine methyltransferase